MQRILFITLFLFISTIECNAQDTLIFNGQPNWKKSLDFADNCFIFQETGDTAVSFEIIKKQMFVPYRNEWRKQKFTNRPLLIQWKKFTVRNISKTDTVNLSISTVHYFTRLYTGNDLIARSGAYETQGLLRPGSTSAYERGRLPVIVPPLTTTTFWLRTEDRQSQLIEPIIFLETIFTGMAEEVNSGFGARYLFLLLGAMAGCFFLLEYLLHTIITYTGVYPLSGISVTLLQPFFPAYIGWI